MDYKEIYNQTESREQLLAHQGHSSHRRGQKALTIDVPEAVDPDVQSRADTYHQGERSPLTTAARIKTILNILNFDIKKPRLLKQPYMQKLRGSLGWEARVILLEGPSVADYTAQLKQAQMKCQQVIKEDSFTHTQNSSSAGQKTTALHNQSASLLNQAHHSTLDKTQDSALHMPAMKMGHGGSLPSALFPMFPEALHRPEQSQCNKFNSELMKKIVCEKRRNNDKFQDGKCMHDVFRYYPNRQQQQHQQTPESGSTIKHKESAISTTTPANAAQVVQP